MFISTSSVEVRYAETDQMGVVYHANYLVWCEIGRTDLIKQLGFEYAQMEQQGVLSPVTNINFTYKYPAKYGETIQIKTWIEDYTGIKVVYGYEISNEKGTICVTGQSEHVCVLKDSFRPISIRKKFPEWHAAYEKHKKNK